MVPLQVYGATAVWKDTFQMVLSRLQTTIYQQQQGKSAAQAWAQGSQTLNVFYTYCEA